MAAQFVSVKQAFHLSVGIDRMLLMPCSAFRGCKDDYSNLTMKKIPKAVLSRCESGKDDYSLKVENLPKAHLRVGKWNCYRSREINREGGKGR